MVVRCLARSLLWGYMACATEGKSGADMGDDLGEWWEGKEGRLEKLRRCIRGEHASRIT